MITGFSVLIFLISAITLKFLTAPLSFDGKDVDCSAINNKGSQTAIYKSLLTEVCLAQV